MTYATVADMEQRYSKVELIKLTNKNAPASREIDEAVLSTALDTASSMIDGYLAVRYSLPLSDVPIALTQAACVIARYSLESGRATDQATDQYKASIRYLTDISKGNVQLGPGTDGTTPDNNDGAIIESAGSVFARKKSHGFI
jgi:phage gp36-like protein